MNFKKILWTAGALSLLLCSEAQAERLTGRVIHVADGDTVTVLTEGNRQLKVRLNGIDAPEKRQAFGSRSGENLTRMIKGRTVELNAGKKDRYGRVVGQIFYNGEDICLAQVKAGMAWVYSKYDKEIPASQRGRYYAAQKAARGEGIGLWSDPNPVEPWVWRKMKKAK